MTERTEEAATIDAPVTAEVPAPAADAPAPVDAPAPADPEPPEADDETARALEPSAIRARRRPRAVLLVWAWELAGAFAVATPVYAWARGVWGAHPDGDAVLFEPGGHALLAWLDGGTPPLAIVTWAGFVAFALFRVLGVIVTGAAVAMLATGRGERGRSPSTGSALRAGMGAFFPLACVGVVASALQGFVFGIGLLASSGLAGWTTPRFGDARAFTVRMATLVLFVVVATIAGIVADLARVAVARDVAVAPDERSTLRRFADGIVTGVRTARAAIGRATLAWSWRAAASLGLLWVGAAASDVVGARGGAALFALFLFHQLVLLARAGLRASWLANALRLVLREEREPTA